jgi:hypothetical protein
LLHRAVTEARLDERREQAVDSPKARLSHKAARDTSVVAGAIVRGERASQRNRSRAGGGGELEITRQVAQGMSDARRASPSS